jgi:carbonic anhydrase
MSAAAYFEEANAKYAQSYTKEKAELGLVAARSAVVITCMDARLVPSEILGLKEGDALVH